MKEKWKNFEKRVKKGLKLLRGEVIGAYPARRDPTVTVLWSGTFHQEMGRYFAFHDS